MNAGLRTYRLFGLCTSWTRAAPLEQFRQDWKFICLMARCTCGGSSSSLYDVHTE